MARFYSQSVDVLKQPSSSFRRCGLPTYDVANYDRNSNSPLINKAIVKTFVVTPQLRRDWMWPATKRLQNFHFSYIIEQRKVPIAETLFRSRFDGGQATWTCDYDTLGTSLDSIKAVTPLSYRLGAGFASIEKRTAFFSFK